MAAKGIKLRSWALRAKSYADDSEFQNAVVQELASLGHMGERLGVGFVVAPIRREVTAGEWETVAWVFQTETIPAAATWAPDPVVLGEENEGTPVDPDPLTVPAA